MMVTLKRLGYMGKEAAVGRLATLFRISEGTVETYTNRCLMAILRGSSHNSFRGQAPKGANRFKQASSK
jgi:hypothetical protein